MSEVKERPDVCQYLKEFPGGARHCYFDIPDENVSNVEIQPCPYKDDTNEDECRFSNGPYPTGMEPKPGKVH
jgi:hypothetical protein